MVRISRKQEQTLEELLSNKKIYEKRLSQIDADARVRKAQEREALAKQVRAALEDGIPARQVALKGLGYADVGSLKQYLTEQPLFAQPVALTTPVREIVPGYSFDAPADDGDVELAEFMDHPFAVYMDGKQIGSVQIVSDLTGRSYMDKDVILDDIRDWEDMAGLKEAMKGNWPLIARYLIEGEAV